MTGTLDNESSFLGGVDPAVIEQLHARYLRDPSSVDPSWRRYFESEDGEGPAAEERGAAGGPAGFRVGRTARAARGGAGHRRDRRV